MLTLTLNPSLDVSTGTEALVPAKKLRCDEPVSEAGGGGVNVARVAKRLGHEATAVMPIGGPTGARLLELLEDEAIPTVAVPIAGETRQSLMVAETSQARQFRFVFPGPELSAEESGAVRAALATQIEDEADDSAVVVISGSAPPGVSGQDLADLADELADRGALVVGDGSGEPLRALARSRVALLKPSNNELAQLSGRDLRSNDQVEQAARDLVDGGPCRALLVSLGPDGALLIETGQPTRRLTPPAVEAVSTVGAGDSMVAATAIALAHGAPLVEAAARGVAAGTAAVLTPGSELCRAPDVDRLTPLIQIT